MPDKISKVAWRRVVALAGATLASLAVTASPAVADAAPGDPPSILRAGHQLVAGSSSDRLRSANDEFILYVEPGGISLWQSAPLTDSHGRPTSASTDTWHRDSDMPVARRDHTVLRLQSNGKLVLRTAKGRLIWWNHVTAGSGSVLSLTGSGNLVVRDRHGVARWASHTTEVFLPAGRRLLSGHRLYDRADDRMHPPTVATLTMGRDGNLVKRCNRHVIWRSGSHSPGAYLSMERSGDLVIRSLRGDVVWHARTNGAGSLTYLDTRSMEVKQLRYDALVTRWAAAIPYDAPC